MNKLQKGIILTMVTTGVILCVSQEAVAIVQAPTQSTWSLEVKTEHPGKEVTILSNPVYKEEGYEAKVYATPDTGVVTGAAVSENIPAVQEEETREKLVSLEKRRNLRIAEEKEEKRLLRKKRLREKRRREEAKRRKEIMACCGVSAGSDDRRILERIVEAEAGGETIHGRLLVANVVLNRVKHKDFPSTVRGVVFSHRGSRYQFSPISDGRYYTVTVSKGTKKAVDQALHGKDPSEGALYFMERAFANRSNARWFDRSLTRLFGYGCHEFFK